MSSIISSCIYLFLSIFFSRDCVCFFIPVSFSPANLSSTVFGTTCTPRYNSHQYSHYPSPPSFASPTNTHHLSLRLQTLRHRHHSSSLSRITTLLSFVISSDLPSFSTFSLSSPYPYSPYPPSPVSQLYQSTLCYFERSLQSRPSLLLTLHPSITLTVFTLSLRPARQQA